MRRIAPVVMILLFVFPLWSITEQKMEYEDCVISFPHIMDNTYGSYYFEFIPTRDNNAIYVPSHSTGQIQISSITGVYLDTEKPGPHLVTVPPTGELTRFQVFISDQVSTSPGLDAPILTGKVHEVATFAFRQMFPDSALGVVLLVIMVLAINSYTKEKNTKMLFLAIYCLARAIRCLMLYSGPVMFMFPIPSNVYERLTSITIPLFIFSMKKIIYLKRNSTPIWEKVANWVYDGVCIFQLFIALFMPLRWMYTTAIYTSVIHVISGGIAAFRTLKAGAQQKEASVPLYLSWLVLLFTYILSMIFSDPHWLYTLNLYTILMSVSAVGIYICEKNRTVVTLKKLEQDLNHHTRNSTQLLSANCEYFAEIYPAHKTVFTSMAKEADKVANIADKMIGHSDGIEEYKSIEVNEGARILVVDDDPNALMGLQALCNHIKLQTTTAKSAVEAREYLLSRSFDCVLTDVQMPGESGVDLCRWIKSTFSIPVFLVTGSPAWELQRLSKAAKADGCFRKPLTIRKLSKAIKQKLYIRN